MGHRVCASTSKEVLDWFATVGNDLSVVVAPNMGWCLCKHWARGAICCHDADQLLANNIDFAASHQTDPDVLNLRAYAEGSITKQEFCCSGFAVAGCRDKITTM